MWKTESSFWIILDEPVNPLVNMSASARTRGNVEIMNKTHFVNNVHLPDAVCFWVIRAVGSDILGHGVLPFRPDGLAVDLPHKLWARGQLNLHGVFSRGREGGRDFALDNRSEIGQIQAVVVS